MVLIVGLFAALALLYFWLLGHWFARAFVFIVLWPVIVIAVTSYSHLFYGYPSLPDSSGLQILGDAIGCGFYAWLVVSLPTFYWQAKQRANAKLVDRLLNPPIPYREALTGSPIAFRKGA